jgi:hypothetical protein
MDLAESLSWGYYHLIMEIIIRNVREIATTERRVLEHVIGRPLRANQQIIIQIVPVGKGSTPEPTPTPVPVLPDWCNVYKGLTDKQMADAETVVLQRSDLSRPSP